MRPPDRTPVPRAWIRRAIVALIALVPLAGLLRAPFAADRSDPDYPHGDFQADCALCHAADAWKPARISPKFDHARFGFALEGAHQAASCTACHTSLDFAQAATRCGACHEDPHRGELGVDCGRCHGARSFLDRGPMVRAHQLTAFPLTGSHAALDCESCHPPEAEGALRFVNARAECLNCHMGEYRDAAVDHVSAGFSTGCRDCHSTLTWSTARVDHDRTAFPLTGAHRATPCASCHGDGVYAGKPTDCASCHMDKYNDASPTHTPASFPPSACATCHNTTSWDAAAFDHSTTAFALTGAHLTTDCASCHGDGVYAGKPTDCASCHMDDYSGAVPTHTATDFPPAACMSCHTTTTWSGATFDHNTYFPIYSGAHAGRWNACTDCHINPAGYSDFTCLSCHPHSDRNETDGHHSGMSDYSYDSASCYRCHPRGTH